MDCRIGCGACCIEPSISSPIPGHPQGKMAGLRCIQLDDHNRCQLFGKPERPEVCSRFQASRDFCGTTDKQAFANLAQLERMTR